MCWSNSQRPQDTRVGVARGKQRSNIMWGSFQLSSTVTAFRNRRQIILAISRNRERGRSPRGREKSAGPRKRSLQYEDKIQCPPLLAHKKYSSPGIRNLRVLEI